MDGHVEGHDSSKVKCGDGWKKILWRRLSPNFRNPFFPRDLLSPVILWFDYKTK